MQTVFGVHDGHIPFHNAFAGGHRGVDLFFVLSGYIIAYAHGGDIGRPRQLVNYLLNRVMRLYPAVWIVTALAFGFYTIGFGAPDKAAKLAPTAVAASALLFPQQGVPLANVTWTLTYEVFFYAVFAVLIVHVRTGLALLLAWQGGAAIVALMHLDLGLPGYYLHPLCLDFSVGLACAWWLARNDDGLTPEAWFAILAAGVASFASGFWLDSNWQWAGIPCALGTGLMILALVRLEAQRRLPIPGTLIWLGGASYSIYLVHYAVLQVVSGLVRRLGIPVSDWLCLGYVMVGAAAGLAFHHWVDQPIQHQMRRFRRLLLRDTAHPPGRIATNPRPSKEAA